jgi:protein-S-isoprenylcysteine O-methyltransferase Ste14
VPVVSPAPPDSRTRRSPAVALIGALVTTAIDAALLALALGGFSALLGHRRALALLAVWGAGAVVLAWRSPVRRTEGTRRTRDPLLLVALLLLPLSVAPLAAWSERIGLAPMPGGVWRAAFGLALAGTGLALRIAAMVRLGARFDPTVAILRDHALETRGLYARIRHPGYTGAWLAALGGALVFNGALGLVPVALLALALALRVRGEERALAEHFGEEFLVYRARTGAFFPRLGRGRSDSEIGV